MKKNKKTQNPRPKFRTGRKWKLYNMGNLSSVEPGAVPPLFWTDTEAVAALGDVDWYCGVEVHEIFIWLALYGIARSSPLQKVLGPIDKFENCDTGFEALFQLADTFQPRRFLMETTGVYHVPVYWKLADRYGPANTGRVVVMNARDVKQKMSHTVKTDKADAQRLAQLASIPELIQPSLVPPLDFFMLRTLLRRRNKLVDDATRLKNRVKTDLAACGLLWRFNWNTPGHVCLVRGLAQYRGSVGEFLEVAAGDPSLAGPAAKHGAHLAKWSSVRLPPAAQFSIGMMVADLAALEVKIDAVEQYIADMLDSQEDLRGALELLQDLPGAGTAYLTGLVLESGDVARFSSAKSYLVFSGIAPAVAESGTEEVIGGGDLPLAEATEVQKKVKKDVPNKFAQGHLKHCALRLAGQILINAGRGLKGGAPLTSDLDQYARKMLATNLPWMKMVYKVAAKALRIVYQCLKNGVRYEFFYDHGVGSALRVSRGRKPRLRRRKIHYRDQCQVLRDNYERLLDQLEAFPLEEPFRDFLVEARGKIAAQQCAEQCAAGDIEQ